MTDVRPVNGPDTGKSVSPLPVSVRTESTAVEEHRVATERDDNTTAPAGARDPLSGRATPSRRNPRAGAARSAAPSKFSA
jgi:hypothetical protein